MRGRSSNRDVQLDQFGKKVGSKESRERRKKEQRDRSAEVDENFRKHLNASGGSSNEQKKKSMIYYHYVV